MKKYLSILAFLVAIGFVSCQKEVNNESVDEIINTEPSTAVTVLRATVVDENNLDTKVAISDAGVFSWQSGDKIAVINSDGEAVEFTTSSSGASVDFSAASSIKLGDFAVYPYDAGTLALGKEVSVNLPTSYAYRSGESNIPMLGQISEGTHEFKAIGGALKLTIIGVPATAKELWFTATNKKIVGDFSISDATADGAYISTSAKGSSDNSVAINFEGNRSDNMVFYIPLPVGTIDGFTIEFDDDENTTKTSTKNVVIERNGIVIAPVLNFTGSPAKTLINETFGTYTGSVASYSFSGTTTYDGTTSSLSYSVSNTGVTINDGTSANITSNNLFFPNSGTYDFVMGGIKLEGASSITVSYKANKANLSVSYSVDGGDYTEAKASSSVGDNSFTASVSGSSLTLKFHNTSSSTNNRLDDIKVIAAASSGSVPTITTGSDAITIAAGSLSNSVTSVKLANPFDASGISFVIDPESSWISSAEIIDGDIATGDAKVRITAASYNHTETPRVGYVYFRATGATSKTITVTQNPSIVPSPSLTATPDDADFSITWTADGKAKSYIGYYSTSELVDPTSGTALDISNVGTSYTATPSASVVNGTVYHVYVKVNEVADASADKYAASSVWAHVSVTPEAPITIADVISGGVDGGPYSVYGLTCFAKIDKNNAIVGDATGRMLLYKSGSTGHGLADGDVFNIVEGSTTLYSSAVYEWNNPTPVKTGTTSVDHGTATVLNNSTCADLVTAFDGDLHSAVYVSGTGTKSGRNITVGDYTLYLGVERADIEDGAVNLAGYVYAYMSSKLSFMATSLSVVGDPSVTAFSWTRSGTTDTVTSGYTISTAADSKTGYYQDGSGTLRYVMVYNKTTPMFSSTPTSITLTAKIGGGTTKNPLTNNVFACLVDKEGNDIAGTEITVTTKVSTASGDTYNINFTPIASAYGVKVYHTKETGYNVRYYSFSLKYVK